MWRTLYGKLAAILLGLILAIGCLGVALILAMTRLHVQQIDQQLHQKLADYLVSHKLFIRDDQVRQEALNDSFEMLMSVNPNIELYLLDPGGRILAYAAPPGKVRMDQVSTEPIGRYLGRERGFPILGDDPRNPGRKKVFSVAAIPPQGPVQAYLYVVLGGEKQESVAATFKGSYVARLSMLGIVAALVFLLAAGLLLFRLTTRRLHRLASAMEQFRQSGFREAVDPDGRAERRAGDEIDRLVAIYREMEQRIIAQLESMRRADEYRREMVTNISHDIRTPIASLQGYVETLLLKGESMAPREREECLRAAMAQIGRLGKRVNDLFELAKLDAPEAKVRVEPFHPAELVQDVVQKFRVAAERKGIALMADFDQNLPFVSADISLVERALENLIENALRYTQDGGQVEVTLISAEQKVRVQVSDNGPGIDGTDLHRVFDRFYRGKRSARTEEQGAGLGLAIAKRIVELHGEQIEVTSRIGSGSTFVFSLPVYGTQPVAA